MGLGPGQPVQQPGQPRGHRVDVPRRQAHRSTLPAGVPGRAPTGAGPAPAVRHNDGVTPPREIVLLGATGSVGTEAIDIVRRNPDRFRVVALGAGGGNVALLAAQALELGVDVVGVARASVAQDLQLAFYAQAQRRGYPTGGFKIPKILTGPDAMTELAGWPCHTVLNGVVGSLGLAPTLAALRAGRQLALANKESLLAGGALVRKAAEPGQIVCAGCERSGLTPCPPP